MIGTNDEAKMPATTSNGVRQDVDGPSASGLRRHQATVFAERYGLLVIWALVILVFWVIKGSEFLQSATFKNIFASQTPLVFLSMALVVTFTVGEFDLSVAGTLGICSMIVAVLEVNDGWNIVAAIGASLVVAVLIGLVNALVVVRLGVDSIIATLGMSTLLLGLANSLTNGSPLGGVTTSIGPWTNHQLLGLPLAFYYGLVLTIVITYLMAFTPLGRHMLFVGKNREVARLAGVRVHRIRFGTYIAAALVAGVGGVLLVGITGGADPSVSLNYLLPAFAAVFLGTIVIMPGRFNAPGTFISIYFLTTGIVGLQILGVQPWISNVFFGGALIIAAVMSKAAASLKLTDTRPRSSSGNTSSQYKEVAANAR